MQRLLSVVLVFSFLLIALATQAEDFDSAGIRIHYEVQGKGDPVILIHGLHASAQINWGAPGIIADLAQHHRVIALDCRGHGQSGKPTSEGSYGVQMVEDVVRLMDHLHLPSAQIAGYSMGGLIALKLAVLHPERVKSITLGGMGWMQDGSRGQEMWAQTGRREGPMTNPALLHGFTEFAVTAAQVKAIKQPITVIIGETDPCRRLYVAPLLKLRPEIPEHVIAGAGHLRCVTEPAFQAALSKALSPANS